MVGWQRHIPGRKAALGFASILLPDSEERVPLEFLVIGMPGDIPVPRGPTNQSPLIFIALNKISKLFWSGESYPTTANATLFSAIEVMK